MSDRLAASATISVLMMSIYVLFGSDAARIPLGPDRPGISALAETPALPTGPIGLLPVAR